MQHRWTDVGYRCRPPPCRPFPLLTFQSLGGGGTVSANLSSAPQVGVCGEFGFSNSQVITLHIRLSTLRHCASPHLRHHASHGLLHVSTHWDSGIHRAWERERSCLNTLVSRPASIRLIPASRSSRFGGSATTELSLLVVVLATLAFVLITLVTLSWKLVTLVTSALGPGLRRGFALLLISL